MALSPKDWNVVVIGHWNRAILSPAGIAKRLFNLADGTPVQVLVPLDVIAPYHIRHETITVIPNNDRLLVCPVHNTFENLVEAIVITRRALVELPRTPVFAAGMNLSYKSESEISVLQQSTASQWDDKLSDKKYVIASRSISRSVLWKEGTINITIKQEHGGASSVSLNFDFKSQDSETIVNWLNLTADELRDQANQILFETIGLSAEDIVDG